MIDNKEYRVNSSDSEGDIEVDSDCKSKLTVGMKRTEAKTLMMGDCESEWHGSSFETDRDKGRWVTAEGDAKW